MSTSYEKVKGSKLTFKGALGLEKKIGKKKKKQRPVSETDDVVHAGSAEAGDDTKKVSEKDLEIDTGTGHAPDGKKSKKYEDLFPVETKRFGYVVPSEKSREAALNERVKKKADRYCK